MQFITSHEDTTLVHWKHDKQVNDFYPFSKFSGHSNTVRYCALSPNESQMVSACEDHSLRVWDLEKSEGQWLCAGHKDFAVSSLN